MEVCMKRLITLIVVLSLFASVSLAADPKPVTNAGAKALLFDLGGLASLSAGNYQGGLGAKYYIAQDMAIRLSLGFRTSTETEKNTQNPLPTNRLAESKLTSTAFTIAPAFTYNVAKTSTVAAYVGGMLSFTTAEDKREGNNTSLNVGYDSGESYRESTTSWGVAGILGVEWFPWENISFSGEYRLGYTSSSGETESTTTAATTTIDGPDSSQFGLGSANSAALTLAIYF
jgi:opacity protein-like surface antigen